jgi:hypothetical protein
MAKSNYTPAQLRACELMDQVRFTLAVHPSREGWICRPHHTHRLLKVGHRLYGQDPYITSEVETLCYALEALGVEQQTGYQLTTTSV